MSIYENKDFHLEDAFLSNIKPEQWNKTLLILRNGNVMMMVILLLLAIRKNPVISGIQTHTSRVDYDLNAAPYTHLPS